MEKSLFTCPICAAPLERGERAYACPNGHAYDKAREGYVHLLPANKKHSKAPGDDKGMAEARRRFLSGGYYGHLLAALCALLSVVLAVSLGFNFYYRYRVLMILDPPQAPSAPVQQVLYAVRPDYETMTYDLALSLTENGGLRGYDTQVSLFTVLPEQPSYQDGNTTVIPAPSYHQEEFPVAFRNKTATLVLENLPFRYHKAAVISLTYSKGELEGTHALLRLEPTGRGIDWIIEAGSSSFGQHPPEIKEEPELLALQ